MLIIGERINSSIKKIEEAIKSRDSAYIQREAKLQADAGAHVIDLNAGTLITSEPDEIEWLIRTARTALEDNIRIAIDSVNPIAIAAALQELQENKNGQKPIINSVTAEREKLDVVLPLAKEYNAQLVGMCMNEGGIPDEPKARYELGNTILQAANEYEIPIEDVYLDPLVLPISTDVKKGRQAFETIKLLKTKRPEAKIIIGLSNISYGLPKKPLLNRTFISIAIALGLDAAILNPLDKRLMGMIKATEAILGNDDFCMNFITAYRNGELED